MISKMRKKGLESFWSNLIGVVLAVAGLTIIFVFVAPKLYDIVINEDAQKAKSTLDALEGRINAFLSSDLEKATIVLQGFAPKDNENWILRGYDKEEPRPDKCFFNTCICTCPDIPPIKDSCQNSGFCRDINVEAMTTNSPNLIRKYDNKNTPNQFSLGKFLGYEQINQKVIPISKNLMELELSKTENSLTITHFSEEYKENKWQIIK